MTEKMITLVPLSEYDRLEYEDQKTCYWLHLNNENVGSIKHSDVSDEGFDLTIAKFCVYFKSIKEAESFVGRPFESVLGDLVQRKMESWDSSKQIPCLTYFDSKYNFKRTKGGWFIYNESDYNPCSVGSIGRGKYGRAYALFLNGLGLTYRSTDLDKVKKKAVAILNGKENLEDVYYTTWLKQVLGQPHQ